MRAGNPNREKADRYTQPVRRPKHGTRDYSAIAPECGNFPVMKRREFFLRSSVAAGVIALDPFPHHLFAGTTQKAASDRVKLGPMGVPLSRLAMGTGTNGSGGSSNQTKKLGLAGVADLFRAGFDQGVTFWDSADQYGTHPHLKEALKGVAREKVTIMTKTMRPPRRDAGRAEPLPARNGTDYIDILLLHCMMDDDWPQRKKGAMAVISEAREGRASSRLTARPATRWTR